MTVTTTHARVSYAADGVATVFPVTFKYVSESDLDVYYVSSLGVVTIPALNIDYTVTPLIGGVGELVFFVAPLNGGRIVILRQRTLVQDTSSIGKEEFSAAEVETIVDNLMFLMQEINDIVIRSLQLGITDQDGAGVFDARGNIIENLADPVAAQDAVTLAYALANLKGDQGDPGELVGDAVGDINMQDFKLKRANITDYALDNSVVASVGGVLTLDFAANGNVISTTLFENITSVVVTSWPPTTELGKMHLFINTGAGGFSFAWPAGWRWSNGNSIPVVTSVPAKEDVYVIMSRDAGVNILASSAGQNY